jgi:TolA-binding protein
VDLLVELTAWEPGLADAHFLLGQALEQANRTLDAITAYRRALRMRPASANASEALTRLTDVQGP